MEKNISRNENKAFTEGIEISKILERESNLYLFIKRSIDIICSLAGIIVLSPIFLIVAVLIKIEDPKGSIIFCQERNGQHPKTFKMYKFRSMVHNAEELLKHLQEQNEQTGPAFKMTDDPRITKVGKFIRKTSLDELPQLFNVLKGDMSLVGPRPPIPREVEQYNSYQKQISLYLLMEISYFLFRKILTINIRRSRIISEPYFAQELRHGVTHSLV